MFGLLGLPRDTARDEGNAMNDAEPTRCLVTKDPCGTDTWVLGDCCSCANCRRFMVAQANEAISTLGEVARERDRLEGELAEARELLRRWEYRHREYSTIASDTRRFLASRSAPLPPQPAPEGERIYPCADCGTMRTKDEGGTVFTVCEACRDRHYHPKRAALKVRVGRKVGRTIYNEYAQLIGVMDTPALAALFVEAVNARVASPPQPGEGSAKPREGDDVDAATLDLIAAVQARATENGRMIGRSVGQTQNGYSARRVEDEAIVKRFRELRAARLLGTGRSPDASSLTPCCYAKERNLPFHSPECPEDSSPTVKQGLEVAEPIPGTQSPKGEP